MSTAVLHAYAATPAEMAEQAARQQQEQLIREQQRQQQFQQQMQPGVDGRLDESVVQKQSRVCRKTSNPVLLFKTLP
ncbi:hypothetical protein [Snodgrassella sp. CFCC 13594]|uniref:hypothetical protein n=1 Tax=Snodgrassella sp. CFCC 13594 TaxID=1775559 RepID=UPI00082E03F3|nr:hypothetical protein [Snodgrassella sp. CFCC 13594]